jgi:hypothetical protein
MGQPPLPLVHTSLDPAKALGNAGDVLRCHGWGDCCRGSLRLSHHDLLARLNVCLQLRQAVFELLDLVGLLPDKLSVAFFERQNAVEFP